MLRVAGCVPLFVSVTATLSAARIDVTRMTPVAAHEPIPIADFFRPGLMSAPQLNPSGTHIAALLGPELMLYDTVKGTTEFATRVPRRDVFFVRWLDDRRLICGLSADKQYSVGLFGVDVVGGVRLFPLQQYSTLTFLSAPAIAPLRPLVWIRRDIESNRDLGVVALESALHNGPIVDLLTPRASHDDFIRVRSDNNRHILKSYPPLEGAGVVTSYIADGFGDLAFAVGSRDGYHSLHRFVGDRWVKCPVDLDRTPFRGVGNCPDEILVEGAGEPGKPRPLQILDVTTGRPGRIVHQDSAYDFDGGVYRDPITQEIIGLYYHREGPFVKWFRAEEREVQTLLNRTFEPGQLVQIISRSQMGRNFVVARFSDRQPTIYSWVNLDTRTVATLKHTMPWIDPQRMRPTQILQYRTRDGRTLDAYLTIPEGASKETPVPLVVLPHGGPYQRDTWGFDGDVQWLASRGYAVLQPNYRGSTGYDWQFPHEDRWNFMKMHEDVTDATRAAFATKLINRSRVAIMGSSFGGYLALKGATREPELYRCAISINGVFDWAAMVAAAKDSQYDSARYGWFKRHFGDPAAHPERFDAISPIRRVDHIQIPVLVIHGTYDNVIDPAQTRELVTALQKHRVQHESLFAEGEGHHVSHLEQRVEVCERIEAFLTRHMQPLPDHGRELGGD